MKIGFGSQIWLRDNHYESFNRMLDDLALLNFDGFEMFYPFMIDWYEKKPKEFKKLLKIHGLEMSSYYTDIYFNDRQIAEKDIKEAQRRFEFAAETGCRNVLIDGTKRLKNNDRNVLDDLISYSADEANKLGEYAKKLGLNMSWHQHWGSIYETKLHFDRLMVLTDENLVGFCCDVGQLALGDFDVIETVKKYIDRIRYFHFKDVIPKKIQPSILWDDGPDVPSDNGAYGIDARGRWVELGRGVIDFPEIAKILLDNGYDGWIVDDLDYSSYPAYDCAKACKDYINHGLGIWGDKDIMNSQDIK